MMRFRTCLGVILLLFAAIGAQAAEPRRVLLLHSFGRNFAPFSDFAGRFREQLVRQSPEPIDLYEASLETARFSSPPDDEPLLAYLRAVFAEHRLDLIVTIGGPAARFVQQYRARLFASTPVLMSGLEDRRIDPAALTANDTVVAVKLDLPAFVDNILRLRPDTTNVAVVIGGSPLEQFWVEETRREFQIFTNQANFIWFNDLSWMKCSSALPRFQRNPRYYTRCSRLTRTAFPTKKIAL